MPQSGIGAVVLARTTNNNAPFGSLLPSEIVSDYWPECKSDGVATQFCCQSPLAAQISHGMEERALEWNLGALQKERVPLQLSDAKLQEEIRKLFVLWIVLQHGGSNQTTQNGTSLFLSRAQKPGGS